MHRHRLHADLDQRWRQDNRQEDVGRRYCHAHAQDEAGHRAHQFGGEGGELIRVGDGERGGPVEVREVADLVRNRPAWAGGVERPEFVVEVADDSIKRILLRDEVIAN